MYCFGDFEFTCGESIGRNAEIISAGIIFCDEKFNEAERYYATVRPVLNPVLTDMCKELTGLTQEEINASRDNNTVCGDIAKLLKKYDADKIFVWGSSDRKTFYSDYRIHMRKMLQRSEIKYCGERIRDIQDEVTHKLGMNQASKISALMEAMELVPCGEYHNALVDCDALMKICECVHSGRFEKIQKFLDFREEKRRDSEIYLQTREQRRLEYLATFTESEKKFTEEKCNEVGDKIIKGLIKIHRRIYDAVEKSETGKLTVFFFENAIGIRVCEKGTPEYERYKNSQSTENKDFYIEDADEIFMTAAQRYADELAGKSVVVAHSGEPIHGTMIIRSRGDKKRNSNKKYAKKKGRR